MRWSAALASALIAGCACLAGWAAGSVIGTRPMMPPVSKPPRTAMCRSFTTLSPLEVQPRELAERGPAAPLAMHL